MACREYREDRTNVSSGEEQGDLSIAANQHLFPVKDDLRVQHCHVVHESGVDLSILTKRMESQASRQS